MLKLSELLKPLNDWHCYEGRYYANAADARQWRRWQEEKARRYEEWLDTLQQRKASKLEHGGAP